MCTLVVASHAVHCKVDCWARPYAAPGLVSDRLLFADLGNSIWDGHNKVAFPNADCTLLAGNFRDTGSKAVMLLFPAATIRKESWPNPQLQLQLAKEHNISSLAVDVAGRGESCGYEIGPGCTSTVTLHPQLRIRWHFRCPQPLFSLSHASTGGDKKHPCTADHGHGCCSSIC